MIFLSAIRRKQPIKMVDSILVYGESQVPYKEKGKNELICQLHQLIKFCVWSTKNLSMTRDTRAKTLTVGGKESYKFWLYLSTLASIN